MSNNVNHPSYYNTDKPKLRVDSVTTISIECIDVIRDMPTWKGNAIKYLWRAGLKQDADKTAIEKEIEDLQKSIWYIQDRINQLKNG